MGKEQCMVKKEEIVLTIASYADTIVFPGHLQVSWFSLITGDSGGPLTAVHNGQKVLVGITSWGPTQCAHPDLPGVFAGVSKTIAWIIKTMKGNDLN